MKKFLPWVFIIGLPIATAVCVYNLKQDCIEKNGVLAFGAMEYICVVEVKS